MLLNYVYHVSGQITLWKPIKCCFWHNTIKYAKKMLSLIINSKIHFSFISLQKGLDFPGILVLLHLKLELHSKGF